MSAMDYIRKLYADRRELALLEWTYFAIIVVSVLIAGIFALFDHSFGISILIVPLVALTAMSMNVVAWALIKLAADTLFRKDAGVSSAKAKTDVAGSRIKKTKATKKK